MSTACVVALAAIPASAQDAADATTADNSTTADGEEVVVTAQKRKQILLDVPISMAAFTNETLEKSNITELGSLQTLVPNFQVSDNVSVRTIYVRGVGGGGRTVAFDTRTGVYLDGVYIGQPASADAILVNLDRVEVLRGPQGYLYGQNTVSGAVNLVTRAPSEEYEAKMIASYGDWNETKLVGMFNAALAENVFLRVGGSYYGRDGFIENVILGKDVDDKSNLGTRAQLRWIASEDLTIDVSADYSTQISHKVNGEARSDTFNTPGGLPTAPADQPFVVDDDYPERDFNRNWGLALTANYDLGGPSITSTTGFRKSYRNWDVDLDHGRLDFSVFNYYDDYKTFSQELRLNGTSGPLTYVVGLYYMNTQGENDRNLTYTSLAPLLGVPAFSKIRTNPSVDNSSYALFGALDYEFAEGWTLNLGARVNYETKELTFNQQSDLGPPITDLAVVSDYTRSIDETSFSPSIGVTWEPDDDTTIYAKWSRGVKSGGFNADYLNVTQLAGDLRLGKETVDSYEIGAKFRTEDRSLTFAGSFFYAQYEDYQVSQFRIIPNSVPPRIELALTNAGQVETFGPEIAVTWLPLEEVTIDASVAWLSAKYVEFKDGGGLGVDYSGNRLEYAPAWTGSVTVDWTHYLENESAIFVRATGSYHGPQYSDSSNASQFYQEGYTLVDARAGWRAPGDNWEIAIYGKNIFDEFYDLGTAPDAFTTLFGKYGDPRTYGVEVSWRM